MCVASEDLNNMLHAALAFHLIQCFLGTIHPAVDLGDVLLECFHLALVILQDRWKAMMFGLFGKVPLVSLMRIFTMLILCFCLKCIGLFECFLCANSCVTL